MIRIVRLLDYTYKDLKTANEDMANWAVPTIGVWQTPNGQTIQSTILLPQELRDE